MAPTAITLGAASARGFGAFTSMGGGGWIFAYYRTGNSVLLGPICINGSGQILSLGAVGGSNDGILTISSAGAIVSQIANTSGVFFAKDSSTCFFDSTNNFLYFVSAYPSSSGIGIAKVTPSSSSYSWTRYYQGSFTNTTAEPYGVVVDSSQNVYSCGQLTQDQGCCGIVPFAAIAKQNSSGAFTYYALHNDVAGGLAKFVKIILSSAQNPIVVGVNNIVGGYSVGCIFSFTSTLESNWKKQISNGSQNILFNSVAKDSSDNYYVVGANVSTSPGLGLLIKYNSSGVVQWQRSLAPTSGGLTFSSVSVSSSGDIYVLGYTSGIKSPLVLVKYNSSGTLQWQRLFTPGTITLNNFNELVIDDSTKSIYFPVCYNGSNLGNGTIRLIIKYPMDGSKLGTYAVGSTTMTISASSHTSATISYTEATASMTYRTTPAINGVGPTLSYSNVSYSSSLTTL
jgi:hypothetical protein